MNKEILALCDLADKLDPVVYDALCEENLTGRQLREKLQKLAGVAIDCNAEAQ